MTKMTSIQQYGRLKQGCMANSKGVELVMTVHARSFGQADDTFSYIHEL